MLIQWEWNIYALMQATELGSWVNAAYRAIKYVDEGCRDLGLDVADSRKVVMRAFATS